MHCLFCDEDTIVYNKNPKYDQCQKCKTLLKNDVVEVPDYESKEIAELYDSVVDKYTKNDVRHYEKLNKQKWFIDFKNKYQFNAVYAFGGGYPKLESHLNIASFISIDIQAELYETKKSVFIDNYPLNDRKFKITKALVDGKVIKKTRYKKDDLISLVHILEHFKQDGLMDILDSLPKNRMILIYGPESSKGTNSNWWHFKADEHLTLFSIDWLADLVTQKYKAEIISKETFSDDMFLTFIKK